MNLKYRIYSVSSQNQEYPALNLQQNSGTWESQKNCTYPQDLTLQFYVPIQTKNMKIMFHQYKIPKLIQLFVRCGKHQKYRKLGLIQPNDNKQSNYIQKQIKTVLFQFPCTFVKLVFHQNYQNELNLFGQVALCSLSFEGEFCPSSQLKQLNSNILQSLETSSDDETFHQLQQKQSGQFPKLGNQKKMSSNFSSILFPQFFQKLQSVKKQSVDREQFQKAAFIKNAIKNFQQIEKQILKLEQLKKLALDEEDYDRCHKLKLQISRKKQMAAYQIKQFNDQLGDQGTLVFSRVSPNQHNVSNFNTHRESNRLQTELVIQKTPVANRSSATPINEYENQVVPALQNKKMNMNIQQSNHSIAKVNQSILQGMKSPTTDRKQQLQRIDESIDMRSYDPNKLLYQFPQLENLDFKSAKKYEQFFDYIRQQVWRMVLSYKYEKYWKLKSAALDEVISLQINEGKHLIAIMQFVAITICDKHTVNVKKSLNLLQKIINLPDKDIWCDPNYPRFFADVILTNLIQLMNDTKQEFRKLAVQVYKNLPQFSLIYLETAIKNIIKTSSNQFNKNKRKSNPRLQLAKLVVIEHYISTFADVVNHLNQIIKWLAQCANDPNSQVKMVATQMLLEIARMDRDLYLKVKEYLLKVSKDAWELFQPQYNALLSQIQSSKLSKAATEQQNEQSMMDIYKKQTMKSKNKNLSRVAQSQQGNESLFLSPRRQRDSDDIQLAYSQQSASVDPSRSHAWFASNNHKQIKVMDLGEEEEIELEGMCDFCYKKYEEATVNDHLLNNCCVVIPCGYCGGAIYLRQMTQHFLSGCEKKKHQQCPRCLLAFQFDQINEHVARKICRKSKSNMERCPFCQEDIQADDVSWVDHAEKCDKIVRPKRNTDSYS